MGFVLGSQELVDEMLRKQDEDPELKARLKGLNINLLLVGTDAPGNSDWQYAIKCKNGRFTSVDVETLPAPSKFRDKPFDKDIFTFKAIGDHRKLVDLVTGKIGLLEAMQVARIEGDAGALVTQFAGITGLLDFMAAMDIES